MTSKSNHSEALSAKCEEVKAEGDPPEVFRHAAQIYNDAFYVYGGSNVQNNSDPERDLWSFDLSKI